MTSSKRFLFNIIITLLLLISTVSNVLAFPLQQEVNSVSNREDFPLSLTLDHNNDMSEQAINLLAVGDKGVNFEVKVPLAQLEIETLSVVEGDFTRVSIPGWLETAKSGFPQLPLVLEQIGVPFESKISIDVNPGKTRTYTLPAPIMPVVNQEMNQLAIPNENGIVELGEPEFSYSTNPEVYQGSADYPGILAEITNDGIVRQQRVIGVVVYPIQYLPESNQLLVYENLQVEISFESSDLVEDSSVFKESEAYETFLEGTLLNYENARQWRKDVSQDTHELQIFDQLVGDTQSRGSGTPWTPPNPGWRLNVQDEGMYKVGYQDLTLQGWPASVDSNTIQLFHLGSEAAIQVEDGGDGLFNESTDYLLFYGKEIKSKYTNDNVYWLTYGNTSQGLRIGTRNGAPGSAVTPAYFPETYHGEGNQYYLSNLKNYESLLDHWLWDYLYPPNQTGKTYNFSLTSPYSGPGTIRISLYGSASNSSIALDHHVKVFLNGNELGEVYWDGSTWQTLEALIPQGTLQQGNNALEVRALIDTGVSYDVVYLDWFELEFPSYFHVSGDQLTFSHLGSEIYKYQIAGFSTNQVIVYDVSNPNSVFGIDNINLIDSGGSFTAQFQDVISTPTQYWTGATTAFLSVNTIQLDNSSDLQSLSNEADHIVIFHEDFLVQAQNLSAYRSSQELRSVAVDVQDIYDQFGYGIVDPAAIHDFLSYAYANWKSPAPSFVVFIGDGHYDPKFYTMPTKKNYIPPYLMSIDPWMGETAADNRYVTLVGDDLMPDMMLGRISVNSKSEANVFVNKIIAYEQTPPPGDWREQILAIADNPDSGGNFPYYSDNLLTCCLPEPYTAQKIYHGYSPYTDPAVTKVAIVSAINDGRLLVNYIGHGYTTGWAAESLFTTSTVPTLSNGGLQTVVLAMACKEGYYINSNSTEALGEVVTRADGRGAIASWSATGNGVATGHHYLDQGFFNAFFIQGVRTIGEATQAGKLTLFSVGASPDLLDTYLLFGDPATVMARPIKALDDIYQTEAGVTLEISAPGVLSNDVDLSGGTLTAVPVSDPDHGSLSLNANGSFLYTPDSGFSGTDSFTYKATDGSFLSNIARVTITVLSGSNNPPVAINDNYIMDEDGVLNVPQPGMLANDYDPEGHSLIALLVSAPSNGEVNLNSDGSFTYTPASDFFGVDHFTYKANDGELDSNSGTVTINVSAESDPPLANDDNFETDENTSLEIFTGDLLANDIDPDDDILSVIEVSNPLNGSVVLDGAVITFNPTTGFSGSAGFDYTISDGEFTDTAHVTVIVNAVNYPPVANAQTISTLEDTPLAITLMGSDPDGDALDFVVTVHPMRGNLSGTPPNLTYTPSQDFNGMDSFQFTVSDGEFTSSPAPVSITVTPVNDPPVGNDDFLETLEDTDLVISTDELLANDTDIDGDSLSVISVSHPINGTVILVDTTITFIPNQDFSGTAGFDYTLSDGQATDTGHVIITVNSVNDPPIANNDAYSVDEGETLNVPYPGILGNDADPDVDTLTAKLILGSVNGSLNLNANGSFTYTPNAAFFGTDSFTYVANDGELGSNVATVTITVNEFTSHQVSIPLYGGWNLVSFNLLPPSTAVADVLASIEGNYTLVYAWDASDPSDPWLLYDPASQYASDLTDIDRSMGFWIKMTVDDTLVVTGTQPETTSISLTTGWNLVGYPAAQSQMLPDALANNGITDYSMVMAYQAPESEPWLLYDPTAPSYANDLTEMAPGWGYWVEVNSSGTWDLPYSLP